MSLFKIKISFGERSVTRLRACLYGEKLSRLARKHFDKFTSEILPCYENDMKKLHCVHMRRKVFPCTEILLRVVLLYGPSTTQHFLWCQQLFNCASRPCQSETWPGNRDNFFLI